MTNVIRHKIIYSSPTHHQMSKDLFEGKPVYVEYTEGKRAGSIGKARLDPKYLDPNSRYYLGVETPMKCMYMIVEFGKGRKVSSQYCQSSGLYWLENYQGPTVYSHSKINLSDEAVTDRVGEILKVGDFGVFILNHSYVKSGPALYYGNIIKIASNGELKVKTMPVGDDNKTVEATVKYPIDFMRLDDKTWDFLMLTKLSNNAK